MEDGGQLRLEHSRTRFHKVAQNYFPPWFWPYEYGWPFTYGCEAQLNVMPRSGHFKIIPTTEFPPGMSTFYH